jgi:hypothetical protein
MFKLWVVLQHPLKFIKILYKDFQAHCSGQVRLVERIASNGKFIEQGRIYSVAQTGLKAKAKGGVIVQMKVTRADGTVEHYIADSQGQRRVK